jgi:hypothetical protein
VRRRRLARTAHTSAQLCENKRTYDEMSCVCDLVLVPSLSWQLIVYVFIAPTKCKTICWHTPASGPSAPAAIASAIPATYAITSKHNVARMSFLSLRLSRACLGKSRPFLKKETKSCLKAERFCSHFKRCGCRKGVGIHGDHMDAEERRRLPAKKTALCIQLPIFKPI